MDPSDISFPDPGGEMRHWWASGVAPRGREGCGASIAMIIRRARPRAMVCEHLGARHPAGTSGEAGEPHGAAPQAQQCHISPPGSRHAICVGSILLKRDKPIFYFSPARKTRQTGAVKKYFVTFFFLLQLYTFARIEEPPHGFQ